VHSLARRLIERHSLHGVDIIEIGCGRGDFLRLLCELGNNRGIGFDPSRQGRGAEAAGAGVRFIRDFYSGRYGHLPAKFFVCRHVLEHVPRPRELLEQLWRTIGQRPEVRLYFEVPNAGNLLRSMSLWDIIYEHCSYFGRRSLARLFAAAGFDVLGVSEAFHGQFIALEAAPRPAGAAASGIRPEALPDVASEAEAFAQGHRRFLSDWRDRVEQLAGRKVVIWGAGAAGVGFLNMVDMRGRIEYAVDINPRKQGRFLPGGAQRVVPPEFLKRYRPEVVIIMNSAYEAEIRRHAEVLGVEAEYIAAR